MRTLSVLVLLAVGAVSVRAQPTVPARTGRVVDGADILSSAVETTLTERLAAYQASSGHEIAVLTVESLNGAVLEPFATEVFRAWGLGDAERNDGVLLLIAPREQKVRIEVGYGLEGDIPDVRAAAIIRTEVTPRFRASDFDGGTLAAVEAITGTVSGTYRPRESTNPAQRRDKVGSFVLVLFGFVFGGAPAAFGYSTLFDRRCLGTASIVFLTFFVWLGSAAAWVGLAWVGEWGGLVFALTLPLRIMVGVFGIGFPLTLWLLDRWAKSSPTWMRRVEVRMTRKEAERDEKRRVARAHGARVDTARRLARNRGKSFFIVDGLRYAVRQREVSSDGSRGRSSSRRSSSSSGSRSSNRSSSSSSSSGSTGGGSSGGGGASGRW